MSLFDLPAELVRQILHTLDPTSFYFSLQTSKLFREHALASTRLVIDQLRRIPGQRKIQPDIARDATALMRLFGKRTSQHLLHGPEQTADYHTWGTPSTVNRKISRLVKWKWNEKEYRWKGSSVEIYCAERPFQHSLMFLEVQPRASMINIYSIKAAGQEGYRPELTYVISPEMMRQYLPAYDDKGTDVYHIARVAFEVYDDSPNTGAQLAVLYTPAHPPEDVSTVKMKVLRFELLSYFGPKVSQIFDIEALPQDRIVSMALDQDANPVILWSNSLDTDWSSYVVKIYANWDDPSAIVRKTIVKEEAGMPGVTPISEHMADVVIQGLNIHLHPFPLPMPHWTMRSNNNPPNVAFGNIITRRDMYLPDDDDGVFRTSAMGQYLATHHHHRIKAKDLNNGEPTCVNTALELIITRDESTYGAPSRKGAFLLKAFHYPDTCDHFDVNTEYHHLLHTIVAQLGGLPSLYELSTLGLKLAVSPRSHRIAIASWRTLLVYALDPQAFLDPEYSLHWDMKEARNPAYLDGSGWMYYRNEKLKNRAVVLEPVRVPNKGVLHMLEWRTEDELWGWGDEGLVRWRIGCLARGERGVEELKECVW